MRLEAQKELPYFLKMKWYLWLLWLKVLVMRGFENKWNQFDCYGISKNIINRYIVVWSTNTTNKYMKTTLC